MTNYQLDIALSESVLSDGSSVWVAVLPGAPIVVAQEASKEAAIAKVLELASNFIDRLPVEELDRVIPPVQEWTWSMFSGGVYQVVSFPSGTVRVVADRDPKANRILQPA